MTLYENLPAEGVAVSRIAAWEADLREALGARAIRIMAPIPGKSVMDVEVHSLRVRPKNRFCSHAE